MLSLRPEVLYHASLERMDEAGQPFERERWAAAVYLAGLAVECVPQAHALRAGTAHGGHHDLMIWLRGCPERLRAVIRSRAATEWSTLNVMWSNRIRYSSTSGLLGYLRAKRLTLGIAGGADAAVRVNARRVVDAARVVHGKGVVLWSSR